MSLLSLSWDVSADEGFVCDKSAQLRDTTKGTPCTVIRQNIGDGCDLKKRSV